jgi:hypothetical protein
MGPRNPPPASGEIRIPVLNGGYLVSDRLNVASAETTFRSMLPSLHETTNRVMALVTGPKSKTAISSSNRLRGDRAESPGRMMRPQRNSATRAATSRGR